MLILMLSNDTFDALLHGQSIQNVQIERLNTIENIILLEKHVIYRTFYRQRRISAIVNSFMLKYIKLHILYIFDQINA